MRKSREELTIKKTVEKSKEGRAKRIVLTAAVVMCAVVMLAGCKKQDSQTVAFETTAAPESVKEPETTKAPETEPVETTKAPDSGKVDAHSAEVQAMLTQMDALMQCVTENKIKYDASDASFVWTALCYSLGQNGVNHVLIETDGSKALVPGQTAAEFATALFADYDELPEIPKALKNMVSYDAGEDAYSITLGDRGDSAAEITGAKRNSDGSIWIVARLYTCSDGETICTYRFHLVDNAYADGITDPVFLYSIAGMEIVPETK